MKHAIAYLVFGAAALTTALPASAGVDVSINLPFFGPAYAPPVIYQPAPYYAPPPAVVYRGAGHWGDDGRGHAWRRPAHGHEKDNHHR